jgi:hypothetical protein
MQYQSYQGTTDSDNKLPQLGNNKILINAKQNDDPSNSHNL